MKEQILSIKVMLHLVMNVSDELKLRNRVKLTHIVQIFYKCGTKNGHLLKWYETLISFVFLISMLFVKVNSIFIHCIIFHFILRNFKLFYFFYFKFSIFSYFFCAVKSLITFFLYYFHFYTFFSFL